MKSGETEPFTTGKVPDSGVQTKIESDVPDSIPRVQNQDRKSAPRIKMNLSVPPSLRYRFESIVTAERRLPNVVMDKVLTDFLSMPSNEPRPYIPYEVQTERHDSFCIRADSDKVERIKARAMSEGRDWKVLVLRALYEYVRDSPDDPVKLEPELEPSSGLEPSGGDLR